MTAVLEPSSPPTGVSFLWLEITGKCQLECGHCYADSSPAGHHGSMSLDDWTRVIDQAAAAGVRGVQFIGGEPTLHPNLADLVLHALNKDLAVEVFTNLVHVSEELWEVFARPGVSLATSYYSDDADQHQEITGRPTYARTKANIAKAVTRGIPLRTGVIDMGGDQRADAARDELVQLGVPKVGYDLLREIGRGVRKVGESAAQLCGQCGDGVAAVLPDGSVRPCIMSRWMDTGNVREQELVDTLAAMPGAREALTAQGMPPQGNCTPCGPQGNCYPIHCHPRA
ncbi:radical SAM/SPASM domain-containing protein [Amycolatopsis sp. GM8]|uniref:radical SAM/SPASM domain-containing protein n=1 Tax=Amycolatopsis sp. GM8 TaxID=2896530 RepID=UPI001EFF6470|nr:radical SAM protein [Amycolatopsis sp. GM8]